ncbi:DUF5134 domain-containing protein [Kitasatospora sp. NPDC052896]|uniref:DUF5134 domain-containing protein n=1 Tax=Kitasatospora sp. NPDC052896 TaxID=3364061 RepID=UPI0037C57333
MPGPAVLSWLLVLLAATTGAFCLARLRTGAAGGHRASRESDAAEAVMALGMAAMVLGGDRLPAPLWGGLFGLLGAVFLVAAAGRPGPPGLRAHRLHHAVGALAMGYMALAMGRSPHPADSGMVMPTGVPPLTGPLLLYFGCFALWTGSRLLTATGHPAAAAPAPASSRPGSLLTAAALPQACRLAMGVGMFAMLLTL